MEIKKYIPAKLMEDSCLLMDDMIFLRIRHKLRKNENSAALYRSQICGCVCPHDTLNSSEL